MECNKCKTEFGYVKMTTKEWVCRKCGTATKVENETNAEMPPLSE